MNDLTKEELQYFLFLLDDYCRTSGYGSVIEHSFHNLKSKILSMIDNYKDPQCPHESTGEVIEKWKDCSMGGIKESYLECSKCGGIYK